MHAILTDTVMVSSVVRSVVSSVVGGWRRMTWIDALLVHFSFNHRIDLIFPLPIFSLYLVHLVVHGSPPTVSCDHKCLSQL